MSEVSPIDHREIPQSPDDRAQEIARLVGLVRRVERENDALRRELAATRPVAA